MAKCIFCKPLSGEDGTGSLVALSAGGLGTPSIHCAFGLERIETSAWKCVSFSSRAEETRQASG